MRIDLGIDFSAAQEAGSFKVLPEGTYTLQVKEVKYDTAGATAKNPGRPYLNWVFVPVGVEGGPYGSIFHITSLPWTNPSGEYENSGIGFLVEVTKALGSPWGGSSLETAEYVGRTCMASVKIGTDNKGNPRNEIGKFL